MSPECQKRLANLCRKTLRNFSYKPNWKFRYFTVGGFAAINIEYNVQNAERRYKKFVTITNKTVIPSRIRTEKGMLNFIYERILMYEIHEAEEWIRFRRERPYYPHTVLNPILVSLKEHPGKEDDRYYGVKRKRAKKR